MESASSADVGEGPSTPSPLNLEVKKIQVGDTVLLKLPTGDIKTQKLEKDSCVYITS